MSDKKTIAFWCENADVGIQSSAEFHVNLWHFSNKKRSDFFEIGILVKDPAALSAIRVYVPFSVGYNEVEDLGERFANPELAQGIFNEALSSTRKENGRSVELTEGDEIYCQVHVFSPDAGNIDSGEMTIHPKDGGSLITITSDALVSLSRQSQSDGTKGYFRLRISPKPYGTRPFVTEITPKDRAWSSGFEVIEYIDCRMNEARTLPNSVAAAADAASFGVAETSRVVFLAVVPVVSSVTSSHAGWHKSRLLETEIWKGYVPDGLDDGMVVYHWRKSFEGDTSKRLQGFSAFVKMQTRKTDLRIIALYVGVALIIGAVGSLIATSLLSLSYAFP
ncbi:hypothetical protein [Roseobacter litoralis]|uniref:hypothetical protein n=1 Tax=Roseobacter litoralis TaxID=42443 RepID=UPI00249485BA|nr:hypothetical protein [Roseobacter litoralis]